MAVEGDNGVDGGGIRGKDGMGGVVGARVAMRVRTGHNEDKGGEGRNEGGLGDSINGGEIEGEEG